MSRRQKTNFEESLLGNNRAYGFYLERLTELSVSMFEWRNLPDTVDERFLEYILFNDGQAVFYKDKELGDYLALQVLVNGKLNVYRIPVKRRAFAIDGYNYDLTIDNSVIIYNNFLRTNSYRMCVMFAKKLYNLDRIIDVNANAQKTPVLLRASETQRLSVSNAYKEWDGNAPVIFGDKDFDVNALTVLKTDAPYVADKLYQLKTQYWNEALTYLGISNLNTQKKERLISDEVTRSQGGVIASRYSRLEARRQAAKQINDMFGLNIEVDYREDFREIDKNFMFEDDSTGGGMSRVAHDEKTMG